MTQIAKNKRAFFDYEIIEKLECGIMLQGCEIKSIREHQVTLRDAYARVFNNELWLVGCHITPFHQGGQFIEQNPSRDRKLLIHKNQLNKWIGKVNEKGYTLVPLSMYFSKNRVKVEVGLGKSKKMHDKRRSLKEKDIKRELDRARKNY